MARLCRFVKLNDRFDTQVFTFLLPKKIIQESRQDVLTKEFIYGYHKWTSYFIKNDRHVGAYLKLQTATEGMKCHVDYTFTMLNREHFTRNESFMEKGVEFSTESDTHGRKTFIAVGDLFNRNFMQDTGEFLVELEMRNITSEYVFFLKLPKDGSNKYGADRLESTYFSFGLSDWSLILFPDLGTNDRESDAAVQLQKHTLLDHPCRVRYEVVLGDQSEFDSGELEQIIETSGNGDTFSVGSPMYYLSRGRSTLKATVIMYSVVSISDISLYILDQNRSRAHCYDKDKQAWMLEADASSKYLMFRLYYTDISHVPRKFSRYVCWNLCICPSSGKPVNTLDAPFCKYFVQQDFDEGFTMYTDVRTDKLTEPSYGYLDPDDQKLVVHVEWNDSHLLVCPQYHTLDDVSRLHKHQMWREILALQAENYALEKQLYSYQQSIAKTNSPKEEEMRREEEQDRNKSPNVQRRDSRDPRRRERRSRDRPM